jgi:hypothetical protein
MEDFSCKLPSVLSLKGITRKDIPDVDAMFDQKVMEDLVSEEAPVELLPPDKIPSHFTDIEKWPKETNLCCHSCCFTFVGPPLFVPKGINHHGDNNQLEISVEGNFCSFSCAQIYIDEKYPPHTYYAKHWNICNMLRFVYSLFTGRQVAHILPAPSKLLLRKYGGTMTEDQFWENMRELEQDMRAASTEIRASGEKKQSTDGGERRVVWDIIMDVSGRGSNLRDSVAQKPERAIAIRESSSLVSDACSPSAQIDVLEQQISSSVVSEGEASPVSINSQELIVHSEPYDIPQKLQLLDVTSSELCSKTLFLDSAGPVTSCSLYSFNESETLVNDKIVEYLKTLEMLSEHPRAQVDLVLA